MFFKLEQLKCPLRYPTEMNDGMNLHMSVLCPPPGARQTGIFSTTPCTQASPTIWCQQAGAPHGSLRRTFQHRCANFQHSVQPTVKGKFNVLQPSSMARRGKRPATAMEHLTAVLKGSYEASEGVYASRQRQRMKQQCIASQG